MGAVQVEGKDSCASAAVNGSTYLSSCLSRASIPRYASSLVTARSTRAHRAPRLGAETSEKKRAIKRADNNALCNPAVRCWADLSEILPKIWPKPGTALILR